MEPEVLPKGEPKIHIARWNVGVLHLIQLAVMIFGLGGAWVSVTTKQDETLHQVQALQLAAEQQRVERMADVKELQGKIEAILIDSGKRSVEVSNLGLMVNDLRHNIDALKDAAKDRDGG